MAIASLINVSQLRDEIGGPSRDTTWAGHVTESQLQDIIDRYSSVYRGEVLAKLSSGDVMLDGIRADKVTITMAAAGNVAEGTFDSEIYIPWVRNAVDQNGQPMDWDTDVEQVAVVDPFTRYRFSIRGDNVVAVPSTTTSIVAYLMPWDDAAPEIAPELSVLINDKIIAAAKALLEAAKAEHTRILNSDFDS